MDIKDGIKKACGDRGIETAVKFKKVYIYINSVLHKRVNKIRICNGTPYTLYHIRNCNVFFGYYDLKSYNHSGDKLLAHVVGKYALPTKDEAEIVWFEVGNTEPHLISTTHTWCWQQGSRLRWNPLDENKVLFNDFINNNYVLREVDILNGNSRVVCDAVYDLDPSMTYGVTLNFSRLQGLRPGYGYLNKVDEHESEAAPADDGVYLVNIKSGEKKLVYSLKNLAKNVDINGMHYINHISIAPDGKHFTFFHLWTTEQGWDMRFYCSDIECTHLRQLTNNIIVSHYCWIDNENMIITTKSGEYYEISVTSGICSQITGKYLCRDGHPNKFKDGFISDTYPLSNSMQNVFYSKTDGTGYVELANVFSDPFKYGEIRCDLHPRVETDGRITIDTTVINGLRSILAFKV